MKFKVLEKTNNSITVEFENKSVAVVPVNKQQNKNEIIAFACGFNNDRGEGFDSADDVPVSVGEECELVLSTRDVDYKAARLFHYPEIGTQLDALYWEREGDDTHRKSIDVQIKLIKEKIPKGKKYKRDEIENLLD